MYGTQFQVMPTSMASAHLLGNNDNSTVSVINNDCMSSTKKRKQDYQYPTVPAELYLQQKNNPTYVHQQIQYQQLNSTMLNANYFSDFARSTPVTPADSPSLSSTSNGSNNNRREASNSNSCANCDQNGNFAQPSAPLNLNDWSAMADYQDPFLLPYVAVPVPRSFSAPENFEFNGITTATIASNVSASTTPLLTNDDIMMSGQESDHLVDIPSPISTASSSSSSLGNDQGSIMIKSDTDGVDNFSCSQQETNMIDRLAAEQPSPPEQAQRDHKLSHSESRQGLQQSSVAFLPASQVPNVDAVHNRKQPLLTLNIDTQPYYQFPTSNFSFSPDSLSSTSPSTVTMPPTPMLFGPNVIPEFVIDPTLSVQLEARFPLSPSRTSSFDSVASTTSSIFTTDQIVDNATAVTPTAISVLTQTPNAIETNMVEVDPYFATRQNPVPTTTRRRRSSQLSNPPNLKYEQVTPALSPPETPKDSLPASPTTTPSPPHTPTYVRRVSISPTILEEDEDGLASSMSAASIAQDMITQDMNVNVSPTVQNATTTSMMRPIIQQYLSSNNPHQLGEKTVMIYTSKVAQKSYGTEKRFLCPPPTTIIVGSHWWTQSPPATDASGSCHMATTLSAPKITVGISGEQSHQQGILEWISPTGSSLDPSSCSDMAFSGKCVSKHLYINDADEKRKRVEVLVKIQSALGHNFGTFPSKPIKVISKPSKKRQSVKNMELCIHHGTTISLFNRIRSQTVSTKYLGVSMNQGYTPWNYGTSSQIEQPSPCFVARTGSWDPFIIWIVNPNYKNGKDDQPQQTPPNSLHPPPPCAIVTHSLTPIPIHYNQPVVLQCSTTGMTSPIMIIRKVDKGSMVIGGESTSGSSEGQGVRNDPVSQLHKVAFQIRDTNAQMPSTTFSPSNQSNLPGPGTYLACIGDVVGMQIASEGRKIITSSTPPNNNLMDIMMDSPLPSPTGDFPPELAATWATSVNFSIDSSSMCGAAIVQSEGGKVIRKRRVSTPVAVKPPNNALSKNRRRVNSLSGVASELDLARIVADGRGLSSANSRSSNENSCALWTEDVTDSAVWTIVGTDCASYTFYSPPTIITRQIDTATQINCHLPHQLPSPPPSTPVTPMPNITTILTATSSTSSVTMTASQLQQHSTVPDTLTIYGENFTRDLLVWFGDLPSPKVEFRTPECLVCSLPKELTPFAGDNGLKKPDVMNGRHCSGSSQFHPQHLHHGSGGAARPILLSRSDGVVFKTGKFWP